MRRFAKDAWRLWVVIAIAAASVVAVQISSDQPPAETARQALENPTKGTT